MNAQGNAKFTGGRTRITVLTPRLDLDLQRRIAAHVSKKMMGKYPKGVRIYSDEPGVATIVIGRQKWMPERVTVKAVNGGYKVVEGEWLTPYLSGTTSASQKGWSHDAKRIREEYNRFPVTTSRVV